MIPGEVLATRVIFSISPVVSQEFIPGTTILETVERYSIDPYYLTRQVIKAHPELQTAATKAFIATLDAYDYLAQQLQIDTVDSQTLFTVGYNRSTLTPYHKTPNLVETLLLVQQKQNGEVLDYAPPAPVSRLSMRCFGHGFAAHMTAPDFDMQLGDINNGIEGYLRIPEPESAASTEICLKEELLEKQIDIALAFMQENAPLLYDLLGNAEGIPTIIEPLKRSLDEEGAFNISNVFAWVFTKKFGTNKIAFRQAVARATGMQFGWRTPTDSCFLDLQNLEKGILQAVPYLSGNDSRLASEMQQTIAETINILNTKSTTPQVQTLLTGSYGYNLNASYSYGQSVDFSFGDAESIRRFATFLLLKPGSYAKNNQEIRAELMNLTRTDSERQQLETIFAKFDDRYTLDELTFENDWRIGIDAHGLMVYELYKSPGPETFSVDSATTIFDKLRTSDSLEIKLTNVTKEIPPIEMSELESVDEVLDMVFTLYLESIHFDELVEKENLLYREFDFEDTYATELLYQVSAHLAPHLFGEAQTQFWFTEQMQVRFTNVFNSVAREEKRPKFDNRKYPTFKTLYWLKSRELLFKYFSKTNNDPFRQLVHDYYVEPLPKLSAYGLKGIDLTFRDLEDLYPNPIYGLPPYTQQEISELFLQEFRYRQIDLGFSPSVLNSTKQIIRTYMRSLRLEGIYDQLIEAEISKFTRKKVYGDKSKRLVINDLDPSFIPQLFSIIAKRVPIFSSVEIDEPSLDDEDALLQKIKSMGEKGNIGIAIVDSKLFKDENVLLLPDRLAVSILGVDRNGNVMILDPLRPEARNVRLIPFSKIKKSVADNKLYLINFTLKQDYILSHPHVYQVTENYREPTHVVIEDAQYKTFDDVHQAVEVESDGLPSDTMIQKMLKNRRNLREFLLQLGVPLHSQRLLRGPNGGLLYFHSTSILSPAQIAKLVSKGITDERPWKKQVNWGDRCFGPSLNWYTDPTSFSENERLKLGNIVCLEVFPEDRKLPVMLKQAYWARNIEYLKHLIGDNKILQDEWYKISKDMGWKTEAIRSFAQGRAAFSLSGALIDALHLAVDNSITDNKYRAIVQNAMRLPFGLRTYVHASFLDSSVLRNTVSLYADSTNMGSEKKRIAMDLVDHILVNKKLFMTDEEITLDDAGNPVFKDLDESLLLYFFQNNQDFRKLLRENFLQRSEDNTLLCRFGDGFNPFNVTKPLQGFLPDSPIYLGTDLKSNTIGLISRNLTPDQYRVVGTEEKEALIKT